MYDYDKKGGSVGWYNLYKVANSKTKYEMISRITRIIDSYRPKTAAESFSSLNTRQVKLSVKMRARGRRNIFDPITLLCMLRLGSVNQIKAAKSAFHALVSNYVSIRGRDPPATISERQTCYAY